MEWRGTGVPSGRQEAGKEKGLQEKQEQNKNIQKGQRKYRNESKKIQKCSLGPQNV